MFDHCLAQEIYANSNYRSRELDDHMEAVVSFLHQNRSRVDRRSNAGQTLVQYWSKLDDTVQVVEPRIYTPDLPQIYTPDLPQIYKPDSPQILYARFTPNLHAQFTPNFIRRIYPKFVLPIYPKFYTPEVPQICTPDSPQITCA